MAVTQNNKEMVPFEHYVALYQKIDPAEAASRCGVKFDPEKKCFQLRLLDAEYELSFPALSIKGPQNGFAMKNLPAQMLLIRFLLEGKASKSSGAFLTYREMPWGEVYIKPFTGRCLTRAAFTFGTRLDSFRRAMENTRAIPLKNGDAGYQIEVMPGYDIRLIVWEGDDEFPPNAQILFSDNFPQAFSAEDRTVVGDIVISDIKIRMNAMQ